LVMDEALLLVAAAVLAGLRICGFQDQIFQAVAHLFVGGLFAAGYVQRMQARDQRDQRSASRKLWLALWLSLVELVCFLVFKYLA
jgi:hypothetical protein